MIVNLGTADRIARLVAGTVLILLPFVTSLPMWDAAWARLGVPAVGAILVLTALIRFCPIYRLFGLRTCRAAS